MDCRYFLIVSGLSIGCLADSYNIEANVGTATEVPAGRLFPITIEADSSLGGIAVTLSALPATVAVSPPTVTLDSDGKAAARALVPYGVSGTVVIAGAFTNTAAVEVESAPLKLCPISFTPEEEQNSEAKVYSATVHVVSDTCDGQVAPAGVPIAFSVTQPGASPVVSTVVVDGSGDAVLPVLVPWGRPVAVVATGGGGSVAETQFGVANPAVISCLTWTVSDNRYSVMAHVAGLPLASVTFAVVPTNAGVVSPATVITDSTGRASSSVTIVDPANPPIIQAVSGNSSRVEQLTAANMTACP